MDMDFEVNMNEYLPLRDVDGDPACQQAWSKPHPDP